MSAARNRAGPATSVRWAYYGEPVLRAALLIVVSAFAGLLFAPPGRHRLPDASAIGTAAPFTIRADRDYDIADPGATTSRRTEAAAAQPPVYDLDGGAPYEAVARVQAGFALMRSVDPSNWPGLGDAFVSKLQVLVSPDDLTALRSVKFDEDLERSLAGLAHFGLDALVVADTKLLPAERQHGLVVRVFRDGAVQGERRLLDLASVESLEQAREEVLRRATSTLELKSARVRAAVARIALAMIRPTLVYNQAETDRRRADAANEVKPVVVAVKRGEKIIGEGERIEHQHVVILEGMRAQVKDVDVNWLRLGAGGLVALLILTIFSFASRYLMQFRPGRDVLLLATLFVLTLGMSFFGFAAADAIEARFSAFAPLSLHYLVPVSAGAFIVGQALSAPLGLLFGLAAGLCTGVMADTSATFALYAVATSAVAASQASLTRERASPLRASFVVALTSGALALAIGFAGGRTFSDAAVSGLSAFLGGAVLLPVVLLPALPLVETVFGYFTHGKLRELASLNHPALKELILQAPGTYHHSILMGSMVEAAARAIGANPLLAKVGAYYHDIGKIRNPSYFSENQRGESRHAGLAPTMSALIVKRHVTDGLELARQWKLPDVVLEVIAQHHGTRLVGSFWALARAAKEEPGNAAIDESLFRYPGPKPLSREAALVLIADACEASARELDRTDGPSLEAMVRRRIEEAFVEGQLDGSDLALRDLSAIAEAMVSSLLALRPANPEVPRPGNDQGGSPTVRLVSET